MLKAEGLVDEDNNPDMDTLEAYADALDLEMPAEAVTNEEKLQVLVDNAEVIHDAVVELANTCQRKAGKGKGKGKGKGSRKVCKKLGNILVGLQGSLLDCGGPDCTLENQVG